MMTENGIVKNKAKKVKLLILDVDGVMTDGRIFITEQDEELKVFNVKDGLGLRLLMDAGIEIAIISGRSSKAVSHRAKDLGIRDVYQGKLEKEPLCLKIIREKGLIKEQVCCIGDDLPDLAMFEHSGLPVAVADAGPEVRKAALFVTKKKGGEGAVRELCELILKAQGKWPYGVGATGNNKIGFT